MEGRKEGRKPKRGLLEAGAADSASKKKELSMLSKASKPP